MRRMLSCALVAFVAVAVGDLSSARADDASVSSNSILLSGRFGRVSIDPQHGRLSELKLRNPDGSISSQPVSGGAVGSTVVGPDGTRYESQYGTVGAVHVARSSTGGVQGVTIEGITLGESPALPKTPTGANPDAIAFTEGGCLAYVTNHGSGTLTPVNACTGVAGTPISVGGSPVGVTVDPNGNVFVDGSARQELLEVEPGSGDIIERVPVGAEPQFMAETPDGSTVLVPNQGSNSVSVVDVATGTVKATIPVGASPTTVAISPDGRTAYVTNFGGDSVTPIDLANLTAGAPIVVGAAPYGAAVTPDGHTLVVTLNRSASVALVNTQTGTTTSTIDADAYPQSGAVYGLGLSPDGKIAYVAEAATNNFSAPRAIVPVNLEEQRPLEALGQTPPDAFVFPGLHPSGVAVSPDGHLVLGADWAGGSVSRFDTAPPQATAPLSETWVLSTNERTGTLKWKIIQHWSGSFSGTEQSDPSIPLLPGTVSTVWQQPSDVRSEGWNQSPIGKGFSDALSQTLLPRNGWATYKLWSPFRFQSDLKLAVDGGYLNQANSPYGAVAKAGAQFEEGAQFKAEPGEARELTLELSPVDKYERGQQLDVETPDASLDESLKDMYESLLNGGAIADQKGYWFGNENTGILTAYEALDAGAALSVGIPGPGQLSSKPYTIQQAFEGYLEAVFGSVDAKGVLQFGFNAGGADDDAGLFAVQGLYQYVISSGNLGLYARLRPAVERLLGRWEEHIAPNGLVLSEAAEGKYYDIVSYGSKFYSTFINSLLFEALKDNADLEHAIAEQGSSRYSLSWSPHAAAQAAAKGQAAAASLRSAINRVLWTANGPHGPMYADWINNDTGQRGYYFTALAQYMPIVFGIASPSQAAAILRTADSRIPELVAQDGYSGEGTLSALWPLPPEAILTRLWPFGFYMNGGMLLQDTYYEVMARALSGDGNGALRRLGGFADGYATKAWWGDNAATIGGAMEGGSGEPYLSDMEITPAALVQGLLGVTESWDALWVAPHLPAAWHHATVSLLYKGQPYCVRVQARSASDLHGLCGAPGHRRPGRLFKASSRR